MGFYRKKPVVNKKLKEELVLALQNKVHIFIFEKTIRKVITNACC
jgi:hypothetical protein